MQPITISKNLALIKKDAIRAKKSLRNTYQQFKDGNEKDKKEDNNNKLQTM